MKQSKKFAYHIIKEDSSWSVEIIRRVTAKKTRVSKRENGFSSEEEAEKWGKSEVETFLKNLNPMHRKSVEPGTMSRMKISFRL